MLTIVPSETSSYDWSERVCLGDDTGERPPAAQREALTAPDVKRIMKRVTLNTEVNRTEFEPMLGSLLTGVNDYLANSPPEGSSELVLAFEKFSSSQIQDEETLMDALSDLEQGIIATTDIAEKGLLERASVGTCAQFTHQFDPTHSQGGGWRLAVARRYRSVDHPAKMSTAV